MQQGLRAVFYEYKYYLLPSYLTKSDLMSGEPFTLQRLKEEFCMAPNFVEESVCEETVEFLEPDHLFEVTVNLCSREEYDEILGRQVCMRCPGCARYEDDGKPDLNGHHREMSLDGVCYEREEKDEKWSFGMCVDYFWYRMAEKYSAQLKDYIRKNDEEKLNEILNAELEKFFNKIHFHGGMDGEKYVLYMQSGKTVPPVYNMIYAYMAAVANQEDGELAKEGWRVIPYTPAGVCEYDGEFDFDENKNCVFFEQSEDADKIMVYYQDNLLSTKEPEEQEEVIYWLDRYLCCALGEEVVDIVVAGYELEDEAVNNFNLRSLKEFIVAKYQKIKEEYGEEAVAYPEYTSYSLSETASDEEWWLPYRNNIKQGATNCGEVAFIDRDSVKEAWWTNMFSYIYVYSPRVMDGAENASKTLMWYLANMKQVPEPLRDAEETGISGVSIGFCDCGENGFILDSVIFEEKKFFRNLRIIAPVLRAFDAKVVVVNENGIASYSCDYQFTPIEF